MSADPVVLLAGGSGGIGSQLAPMFPAESLVLQYHSRNPAFGGQSLCADLTDYESVATMVARVLEQFHRIDVVVNASGVSIDGFAHKMAPELWRSVIEVNLLGTFNLVRAVLPSMRAHRFGRIILISSVVCDRPVVGTSAYSASKAALTGLTRTLALEGAITGVTCNTISLGYFDAGMLYAIPEKVREDIREAIPLKRFGTIDELYATIQYLIRTEYMTGQVLSLNGGLSMD